MELRPGYKETDVGVIPEDWGLLPFEAVLRKIGAKQHQIQTSDYLDFGAFPVVDQGQRQVVAFSERSDKVHKTPASGVIVFGDHTCIFKYIDFDFIVGADGTQVLATRGDHSTRFHAFALEYRGVESTGYNRHFKILKERLFLSPPPEEQRAIAAALEAADKLIASLEALIAKKRDLKQAAMQQLLTGKIRLPGFGGSAKLVQTEYGRLPDDWQVFVLSDLIDGDRRIRYGIVQPGIYDRLGRYMIRGQDYSESKGWASPSDIFRVSDKIEQRYRNARVRTGDLIMTIVGYCGHVETVPEWLDGANLTQTTARISIDRRKADSRYCKYALQTETARQQVSLYLKGNAQPGLNCGDVERFVIALPDSIKEQTAIAEVLTDMDAELDDLVAQRNKARAQKQGMMQELLMGRIRLV